MRALALAGFLLLLSAAATGAPRRNGRSVRPSTASSTRAASHGRHVRQRPTETRFLSSEPIGPLALVRAGTLSAPERACRKWGPVGSRWVELDSLGRPVGEVRVRAREYYEVSQCDELSVQPVRGRRGAGIYVAAGSSYHAPAFVHWQPSASALKELGRLVGRRQQNIENLIAELRVPLSQRSLFFEQPGAKKYAIVGGRSLLVWRWAPDGWHLEYEQLPPKNRSQDLGYKPLVATDMNDDGLPELVFHHREEAGEWYADRTLSLGSDGRWKDIGTGIFGSTA